MPRKQSEILQLQGTFFTILIYITSSVVIMGIIPQGDLVNSNAPFADAAALFWGDLAKYIVAGGAVIATLGALKWVDTYSRAGTYGCSK